MKRVLLAGLVIAALLLSLVETVAAAPPADNPGKGPPELERIDFIHYVKDFAPGKPLGTPGKGPGGGNGDEDPIDHYKLSKLILTETATYYIDASDSEVNSSDAIGAITAAFEAWDDVTVAFDDSGGLFDYAIVSGIEYGRKQNWQNTVSWGTLDVGIIAVATMWYIPGKPPREIVEFDVVFNTYYDWDTLADDGADENAYIVENIATHEAGHPVGLADLYEEIYSELTMYGYSEEGETKKTSLESGDKLGTQVLYGE